MTHRDDGGSSTAKIRAREAIRLQRDLHGRDRTAELEAARTAVAAAEQTAYARLVALRRSSEEHRRATFARERMHRELDQARAESERAAARVRELERSLAHERSGLEDTRRSLSDAVRARAEAEAELERRRTADGDLAGQLAAAQRARAEAERQLAEAVVHREAVERRYAAREREHAQLVMQLSLGLADVRSDLERVSRSRAWRLGHGLTRALRRATFRRMRTEGAIAAALDRIEQVQRQTRALPAPPADRARIPVPGALSARQPELAPPDHAARRRLAGEIRERLGPAPEQPTWRLVSIVVLNRNGAAHLTRLFEGLMSQTDYPAMEVVVVDNGSTDGSLDLLDALETPFDVHVIANPDNAAFSEANNQAVAAARGDLLLFLNNDVEPFEPLWLREMVACIAAEEAGAVGATLLYTEAAASAYPVQHRGIRFTMADGLVRGVNAGEGESVLGPHLGQTCAYPAVTAACLLMERSTFDQVGGFPEGYRYGTEDIDLGLRLTEAGRRVVCCGRAMVLHAESATQDVEGREFKRSNRTLNRQIFLERWGPRLRREYMSDRLDGAGYWSEGPPHMAITVTSHDPADGYGDWYTAHELGDALEADGWRVSYVQRKHDEWYSLPPDVDYLLVLLDAYDFARARGVTTIAWVRNWTERWIERPGFRFVDVVLASSPQSAAIIEHQTGKAATVFPLATNPERFRPGEGRPELAADYVFTGNRWDRPRDIQRAVRPRPGERFRVFGRGWEDVSELAEFAEGPVDYDALPDVYASAKVVIDDTAEHALPFQALNSRIFDALATGTPVITNCGDGAREMFGDDFPIWSSPEDLREQLDALLRDDERRGALAARQRRIVLDRHTYARRAQQLRHVLRERVEALSFCIKIGAPDWERARQWGDLYFARSLQRQLERRGHQCRIQILPEWDDLEGCAYDVVLHLKGLTLYRPKPGQLNVMWNISHPDLITPQECDGYDLVLVASERFAGTLRGATRTPVVVLDQATDPELFFPDPATEYEHELAFVGNSRSVRRRILEDLLPTDYDLAVWGADWDGIIDPRHVVGDHVPNTELRKVYSSAAIVLNDHWDDMRERGFLSNRIYDALACGAVVLSDDMPEIAERFGDAVVTYRTREELARHVERLLASPEERRRRAEAGRRIVLDGHTFEHRTAALLDEVARAADAGLRTRIGAPDRAEPVLR